MGERKYIVGILFADVKDFSKVSSDDLIAEVVKSIGKFIDSYLNKDNHFFHKTSGDGLLVCSFIPYDSLEIALHFRDWFRNENWLRKGFTKKLTVRIGLHAEKATIHIQDDGRIFDISGKNVNAAARIEPIVEEDEIFCSEIFYRLVKDEAKHFAHFEPLGNRKLAKNFGEMELYRVIRGHEHTDAPKVHHYHTVSKEVRIRKEFTDQEKQSFLHEGFEAIKEYFKYSIKKLMVKDTDLTNEFHNKGMEFSAVIYFRGTEKATCRVFISSTLGSSSIGYSTDLSESHSSFNEQLYVETDGYVMYLKPIGMLFIEGDRMDYKEAAEYLFSAFAKQLEM